MRAKVGDRLRFRGRQVGMPDHMAEVTEVLGENGEPPYRVVHDNGHEATIYPESDCVVEPRG
ncbi:DUF1918 domain-containing protein [Glycomyces buryatensis]|uniref:DUF1918 domain-containing protein n=1 Tax=Glycomyces buryatensis TaxID=2570927 RepID=A0A4S8QEK5_9ACTN|nr:DUF1918 domain-containing protein [Glycomyces buryatensis]THV42838.1 DUF1918 domain-containing protein [Glycomyces buryatensis]